MTASILAGEQANSPEDSVRRNFLFLWAALQIAKLLLAVRVPLLVDEAFYAWEGRFPAWAYSDLPGLTAWLTRLGTELAGHHALALRAPFLLMGAAIPWMVVRISRRWFGPEAGWWAGLFALLMPLSGLLGILALPDVALVFASLLCLDAIASLRDARTVGAAATLAIALCIGALSHYRFLLVIAAGLLGLVWDARGRALLRDWRVCLALLVGMLAWIPLLAWNIQHGGAGLRFQLLERNPWHFDIAGASWLPIQFLLVTPFLFVLLLWAFRETWRRRNEGDDTPWRLIAGVTSLSVLGWFVLGFFADRHRVSFHWPLAGWLVLISAAPVVFARWGKRARALTVCFATIGLVAALSLLAIASLPAARASLAGTRFYPGDFAGWNELYKLARTLPIGHGTKVVASDFGVAAQLAWALDRPDIHVLDSPLNEKHGRASQLRTWGLQLTGSNREKVLLVVNESATAMKDRLAMYHGLCDRFGKIGDPAISSFDHDQTRFLVFLVHAGDPSLGCVLPAIGWIDTPLPGAAVKGAVDVAGWAFKDGVGLSGVEILIDGRRTATAEYGASTPHVAEYWKISTDPNHPRVGFRARVDSSAWTTGEHWLQLRMLGADGSVVLSQAQRLVIQR